jgi:hypothetical protein
MQIRPATAAANVAASARALRIPADAFLAAALRYPVLFYQRPATLLARARRTSRILRLPLSRFGVLALKHPSLFQLAPGRIAEKLDAGAHALGLALATYRTHAIKSPTLLRTSPARLAANAAANRRTLKLSAARLAAAARRCPGPLLRNPERIRRFIAGLARCVELTPSTVRALVTRRPVLLNQRPDTLARNISETAWRLGAARDAVLQAARRNPAWFYLGANAISLHALRASAHLKLRKAEYVQALLRAPTLVCRDPRGLAQRAALVRAIARACGTQLTNRDLLATFPTALTYGARRLQGRLRLARAKPGRWRWTSLISMPPWKLRRTPRKKSPRRR